MVVVGRGRRKVEGSDFDRGNLWLRGKGKGSGTIGEKTKDRDLQNRNVHHLTGLKLDGSERSISVTLPRKTHYYVETVT